MSRFAAVAIALLALTPLLAAADQTSPKLDGLFRHLQAAEGPVEAKAVEGAIWSIWTRRGEDDIDAIMAEGIIAMQQGDLRRALSMFDRVVARAPDFAEGWNKRATVHYMAGRFNASVLDIQQTLTLEPRHFGALSGMGLIYDALGNGAAALKVWEKALEINPHMAAIRARAEKLRDALKANPI